MSDRSSEGWKARLYHASRSRAFLWKFAVLSLLSGVAVGVLLSRIQPSESYLFGERVLAHVGLAVVDDNAHIEPATEAAPELIAAFAHELTNPDLRFIDVIWAMPALAPFVASADHEHLRIELNKRFGFDESALAIDFLAGSDVADRDAFARVKNRATRIEPIRFARYILGRLEMKRGNFQAAYELFDQEGQLREASESRFMAVRALSEAKDFTKLATLREKPGYREFFTPHVDLESAIATRDWLGILKAIPVTQIYSYRPGILTVTIIAGVAWALFLIHLGEVTPLLSRTAAVCGFGFVAGVISTTPTIFLVIVQDDILGFTAGEDVYRTFAYYIAGVGAREELCKLLLFAFLLPFLIKQDDELEALTVACFVGLGFAIEENANYFMLSAAASAPSRFLTANFFHIALTGLNGLALFRACTRGMSGLNDLMIVLPLTITAHGVYDALLNVPEIDGGGFLAMIVYIVFSTYFFKRVHALRNNVRTPLGLTGSFVIGISVLAGTVAAYQMATLGAAAGVSLLWSELLGSGLLLFMFFREFNEPLAA
jgi:hypothetical protein